jgi:hypothetical protein
MDYPMLVRLMDIPGEYHLVSSCHTPDLVAEANSYAFDGFVASFIELASMLQG